MPLSLVKKDIEFMSLAPPLLSGSATARVKFLKTTSKKLHAYFFKLLEIKIIAHIFKIVIFPSHTFTLRSKYRTGNQTFETFMFGGGRDALYLQRIRSKSTETRVNTCKQLCCYWESCLKGISRKVKYILQ